MSCMKKDYYLILGLTPEATAEEIRSAYRRLAIELHPDLSGFGSDQFLELQEAYSVLSDPMRRTPESFSNFMQAGFGVTPSQIRRWDFSSTDARDDQRRRACFRRVPFTKACCSLWARSSTCSRCAIRTSRFLLWFPRLPDIGIVDI